MQIYIDSYTEIVDCHIFDNDFAGPIVGLAEVLSECRAILDSFRFSTVDIARIALDPKVAKCETSAGHNADSDSGSTREGVDGCHSRTTVDGDELFSVRQGDGA